MQVWEERAAAAYAADGAWDGWDSDKEEKERRKTAEQRFIEVREGMGQSDPNRTGGGYRGAQHAGGLPSQLRTEEGERAGPTVSAVAHLNSTPPGEMSSPLPLLVGDAPLHKCAPSSLPIA